ncbi:hypothetical protein Vretimale_14185 [Volvox reticuliferus]|uniref:FGFR1 oncogene partner (FOP) N-terminal dimerisation domain-containing protein n=1 Tax=Volvox reticuliferus TaxID=1737510 RepID=A0A8J4CRC9_9CHLO|nr:hypothetical protein Vretifemale_15100 [Volvox reticuliferus]GIM10529.1 hypothetical protein Vretimale_14185 [Volvox reticuliferus]
MDDIKQAVVQTLEKQGIIAQLKAQLRAQVFLAIEEYDSASSGSGLASKTVVPARNSLLSESDGQLAIQLVLDLLDTCNLIFTKRVFQPELGSKAPDGGRHAVAQTLGLKPSSTDEPLLVTLLRTFKSGSSVRPAGTNTTPVNAPLAQSRPAVSNGSSSGPVAAAPDAVPASVSQPSVIPAASSLSGVAPASSSSRTLGPVAPLSRLEPLGKPSLGPLPQLGASASTSAKQTDPVPVPVGSKPLPEPSVGDTGGYDDDFEDVDEDVDALATEEGDDDLAAALGCTSTSGVSAKESGKERLVGGFGSSSRGRTALDADLMAGDRSFGVSQELVGLDAGHSGGLSYSTDFPGGDMRASLSSSQAFLSPINEGPGKLAKLEPLRPLGASKLSPLAPLAPLPSISSSLSSSKDDPLGTKGPKPLAPLGAPVRKSMVDIEKEKEELRRLGLLQSGDSLTNSVEVESRPRPVGAPSNIYDAEMSVSASMDEGAWGGVGGGSGGGGGGGGGARDDKMPVFGNNKGISMDLGATGLSASDRSGDIGDLGVDFAETAEWH